jgi:hypothetical protein
MLTKRFSNLITITAIVCGIVLIAIGFYLKPNYSDMVTVKLVDANELLIAEKGVRVEVRHELTNESAMRARVVGTNAC